MWSATHREEAMSASKSVVEALDRIRDSNVQTFEGIKRAIELCCEGSPEHKGNYLYPQIANGPVERVIAFNNDETIALKDATGKNPHFSSHGVLTDLEHNPILGSAVETTFPIDPANVGDAFKWPPPQKPPFDAPPVVATNAVSPGASKQAYFFDNRANSLVTVGPSLPKILLLENGGGQFWVGSIGVITQGTGKYKGVRGMSVYLGSAYLEEWPDEFPEQVKLLSKGFKALVSTYFKIVLGKDQAGS
jgi:hypothetical protein